MNEFLSVKQKYNDLRELERKSIIDFLVKNKFIVKSGYNSGNGLKNYTSGKKFTKPYDNSNWKWIECSSKEGKNYIISLQSFEIDPNTNNHHVLMDRIGIYTYKHYNASDAFTLMAITEIDLPMNDDKLIELLSTLNEY